MGTALRPPDEGVAPARTPGLAWLRHFLLEQSFSPEFFPASLRHPALGYLIAIFLQLIMVLFMVWFTQSFSTFRFIEAPLIFAVLLVALGWGVGPSVLATIFGAFLLALLLIPPYFSLQLTKEDALGLILYIVISLMVSVVASQTQRARRVSSERASQLEAILEGITDGVFIIGTNEVAQQMNTAARTLLNLSDDVRTGQLFENGRPFDLYDEYDRLIPYEQWPQAAIMAGEVLQGAKAVDVVMHTYDKRKLYLNVTGAPVYMVNGQISGAVLVCRDVTARRLLEQRVQASEQEASNRASQLEATFEAIVDGVLVYDRQGRVLRVNSAYQKMIVLEARPEHILLSPQERGAMLELRDEQGITLNAEQMPVQRMLAGDILTADRSMDIILRAFDGHDVQLNVTGMPLYEQEQLAGGVLIFRDVTERRALERRTQQALQALLMMAEEAVRLPDMSSADGQSMKTLPYMGKRLAELIRQVLSCQRVSLTMIDAKTHRARSLAVVGLTPEQERLWLERESGMNLEEQLQGTSVILSLASNEARIVDFTQMPLRDQPNPFGIEVIALAPMKVGKQRFGVLGIDYGSVPHAFTKEEMALIQAVADLTALVLERERVLADRAEAQANVLAAQEANRLMEEFIGIAGHELRTPLTTIKASVQLAKRQVERLQRQEKTLPVDVSKTITNVHDFLTRTERQVSMQNRLISDLLDVSRIQTGRLELHPELHDMIALVQQVVEDQHYLTPDRVLTFEGDATGELLVMADADRVRQVITNYLSNALKYSATDKPVEVRVETRGVWVRVAVRDEGPGLSESQMQQVWERFYRVPGVEVKSGSGVGLGLGLHISRMIVERQGGKVGVESTPGVGSTFWFALPLAEK